MISKKILIASLTGIILAVGIAFFMTRKPAQAPTVSATPCPDFQESHVTVGERVLSIAAAQTHEEKVQGLSDCSALPENSGLLFPYEPAQPVSFWMKNMLMPLDIIWIKDGKVVGLAASVPAPAPNTPAKDLPQYQSPGPVDSVLEIKSGGAEEYGIKLGSPISSQN